MSPADIFNDTHPRMHGVRLTPSLRADPLYAPTKWLCHLQQLLSFMHLHLLDVYYGLHHITVYCRYHQILDYHFGINIAWCSAQVPFLLLPSLNTGSIPCVQPPMCSTVRAPWRES